MIVGRIYSYNNTPQHEARAVVDRQIAQTPAAQTGTTETGRLSHLPGTSGALTCLGRRRRFLYNTTMNATVSVDTIYALRLAQPNKKKREKIRRANAPIFALLSISLFRTETGAAPISYITSVLENIWLFVLMSFGHRCRVPEITIILLLMFEYCCTCVGHYIQLVS